MPQISLAARNADDCGFFLKQPDILRFGGHHGCSRCCSIFVFYAAISLSTIPGLTIITGPDFSAEIFSALLCLLLAILELCPYR